MVAVFLRQLEYFQGIIFLTSNRVGVFDPAIKSRIHLALQYHNPSKETRRTLWKHCISPPDADDLAERLDDAFELNTALDELQLAEMNGREIANAVNTARTLASSENRKLGLEDLRTIVGVWEEFEGTLKGIQASSQGKK